MRNRSKPSTHGEHQEVVHAVVLDEVVEPFGYSRDFGQREGLRGCITVKATSESEVVSTTIRACGNLPRIAMSASRFVACYIFLQVCARVRAAENRYCESARLSLIAPFPVVM